MIARAIARSLAKAISRALPAKAGDTPAGAIVYDSHPLVFDGIYLAYF